MDNPLKGFLSSKGAFGIIGIHPVYLHAISLLLPVNIYTIGNWLGAGVQCALFRIQVTSYGTSFITCIMDVAYILNGTIHGRTALSIGLWLFGTILLIAAFFGALVWEGESAVRFRGISLFAGSFALLFSSMVQYGLLFHGPAGFFIPVGFPVLLALGFIILRTPEEELYPEPGEPVLSSRAKTVILLFFICFLIYNTASAMRMSGDTTPAQIIPISLLKYGEIYCDSFTSYFNNPDNLYAFVKVNGHYYSYFPIVTPILVIPFYTVPYFLISILQIPLDNTLLPQLARFAAALVAAAGVAIVYLSARELFSVKTAIITALTYAYGTSTWAISSQALWQQGMVELLLALILFTIVRNEMDDAGWHYVVLGVLSGLLAMARPPDALLLLPILLYVLWHHRQKALLYIFPGLFAALPFLLYNFSIFGSPFGGYQKNLGLFSLAPDVLIHFAGFLAAPNMGFFIFSPVLLFGIWGYFRTRDLANPRIRELMLWYGPTLLLLVLLYSFYTEWTGVAYGPRFLTGLLPVYIIYVGLFLDHGFRTFTGNKRAFFLWIFTILLLVSIGIQVIGVFYYPFLKDVGMNDHRIWDINESLILRSYMDGADQMTTIQVNSIPPLPPLITMRTKQGDHHLRMDGPSRSLENMMKISNQSLPAIG